MYEAAAADLPHEAAAARAKGLPFSEAELYSKPLPDDQNAALIYRQLDAYFEPGKRDPLLTTYNLFRFDDIPKLKSSLKACAPILALLRKATDRPHCRFGPGHSRWFDAEDDHLKIFARLLVVAALGATEAKAYKEAADDIKRAAQIGRHCEEIPGTLARIIAHGINGLAIDEVLTIVNRARGSADCISAFENVMPALRSTASLEFAFKSQFAMEAEALNHFQFSDSQGEALFTSSQMFEPKDPYFKNPAASKVTLLRAELHHHIENVLMALNIANSAEPRSVDLTDKLLAFERNHEEDDRLNASTERSLASSMADESLKDEAWWRLAVTALHVLRIKNQTGSFPQSYKSAQLDPYGEKPFIYLKTSSGFRLKSHYIPVESYQSPQKFDFPHQEYSAHIKH
jgi:hypothetical protein